MKAIVTYRDVRKGIITKKEVDVIKNDPRLIVREFCRVYSRPWWTFIIEVECDGIKYPVKAIAEKSGVERK